MYIGGHSKYHALDDLLEAAKILQDRSESDIRFVLIGDGNEKPRLMEKAKTLKLTNVVFRDAVARTDMLGAVNEADCFVICSRSMPIHRYGISPNKLCDAMLAGRPIIMALPASNDLVAQTGAGFTIPPQNTTALADAVVRMRDLPAAERLQMGQKGQVYALANFDAGNLADKFLANLNRAA
jgi:glycosyltransferase involved in cell wall biosynthesis